MNVSLRVGEPEDVDAAVGVYVRSGNARRSGLRAGAIPDDRIEEVRNTLNAPETWFFVAFDGDAPVGMAAAMPSHELEGAGPVIEGQCYLDLIFVVPEQWRRGIGALLLDTVIADARGRGFTRIHLLTHDTNVAAQALYASREFERTGFSRVSRDPRNGVVVEWARTL